MRILLAHNKLYYPSYGGGDKSNRLLMEALAARGNECRVLCRVGGGDPAESRKLLAALESRGIPVRSSSPDEVRFTLNRVEIAVVLHPRDLPSRLAGQIGEFGPDIVLTSTDDPALLLLETALKAGGPRVVYLARTTLDVPFGPDCAFPSLPKTELLRQADAVVGVSQYVADYLRRWGGLPAVHVPISLLEPGPYPLLGRFDNEFVTMVNPCAVKGITIFLALADLMPGVRFAAVPTWGTNQEDLAALRARPNVALLPPSDKIDDILGRSRVLLVPSLWAEARSRIIPEAMLRGVPVMAAAVGGIPEAMLGADYLLPVRPIQRYRSELDDQRVPLAEVPEQDLTPWQAALERLLKDRSHYEQLSILSREKALAYTAGLSVEPFESLLQQARRSPRKTAAAAPAPAAASLDHLSPERRRLLALRLQRQTQSSAVDLWFPSARTAPTASVRLFCFPFAGAGASAFRGWAERLPAKVSVCPARLPGRESRSAETPICEMQTLVHALGAAMEAYLDQPFAFYGHSMGAAIAFELARHLRSQGRQLPLALFVSGARAPNLRHGHVPPPEPTEEEFLRELDKIEGLPPDIRQNQDLLRLVLPALMADSKLYRKYVYAEQEPLVCPICVYGGQDDRNVRLEHLEAWRRETAGPVQVRTFPGGHFFIQSAQTEFLAALAGDLDALIRG